MRIAIADDYQDCVRSLDCFSLLAGHDVTVFRTASRSRAELAGRLRDADAVVVVRERIAIDADLLAALPRLRLVALVGRHSKLIDYAACTQAGVIVTNGVESSPIAPAELTMALILASRRNVVTEAARMKVGMWPATLSYRLAGSTLGIFGLGAIGSLVARAGAGLGMRILVWGGESSRGRAAEEGYEVAASKAEFFQRADVLSMHLRYSPRSANSVTRADLALMKPSALFVNTARAELVESGALEAALAAGRPGFAAVDVYEDEPVLDGNHPLLEMDNALCLPHLGWADRETFELYFGEAFEQVRRYASGEELRVVNKEVLGRDK
ncbi:D-2-hydroxyacid dehydrogenase family protein [Pigmentiphaga soli]|uniref:D-2-hydroxyacid dehydrogenase family protein n=1 Tax=Pigmentiphaga soli TaxID=1007095 RepID=A0ABP8GS90_9BURK